MSYIIDIYIEGELEQSIEFDTEEEFIDYLRESDMANDGDARQVYPRKY